jgi:hypothetical protein
MSWRLLTFRERKRGRERERERERVSLCVREKRRREEKERERERESEREKWESQFIGMISNVDVYSLVQKIRNNNAETKKKIGQKNFFS